MFGTSPVNAAMALCNMLAYVAEKAVANEPSMDLGQTFFGARGKGTIQIIPFQFSYPKAYKATTDALQPVARIPLLATDVNAAGVDVSGIDFSKPVCLTDIGDKMKQGGGIKRPLQALGAAVKMMGANFCFQLPGLDASGTDLLFGLKMSMTAFDKSTVDFNNFLGLIPKAWNTMTKDMTDGKGIKDLMDAALNLKPLSGCAACGTYKEFSMNSATKDFLTVFWPTAKITKVRNLTTFRRRMQAFTFWYTFLTHFVFFFFLAAIFLLKEIDIGKIIGKVDALKSIMKGDLFKFPNMFTKASRRRMLSNVDSGLEQPIIHRLPVGPLKTAKRLLAADSTLKFKYSTWKIVKK